ncbi:hypothetical protein G3570_12990 [Balneolaceae bacterium YR4-1]|uniref:Uncharacterized protein n=1 Tax=Halalkalibaculum roseum TaxID=2709311 RepID=A0A6M1T484_9BACT|nr:clostripain-related cysteine peptidase [Halalkalibaculum roseum]NGP77557.1 hypothetical protein [Halalkalibaculum roseum]
MKNLFSRTSFSSLYIALILFFLAACSSSGSLKKQNGEFGSQDQDANYSIIYLIHGDADYLYHDSLGRALQADRKVLEEAIRVGEQAKSGEVFIFHQRPERKVLWIFPKKDRRFIHYRAGERISEKRYSPTGQSDSGTFSAEARLYDEFKSTGDSIKHRSLLYFGHEIPYENGKGYYHSLSSTYMNTDTFSSGIQSFLPGDLKKFDLITLSTCNNGSPDMVHALKPHTRYLLASPQNLHLSHIDTEGLFILENRPDVEAREVADKLSKDSYLRLTKSIQTVVSLSVYDMHEVGQNIQGIDSTYQNYLKSGSAADPGSDNIDCTELPFFDQESVFTEGVSIRYRPPRFGPKANKTTHSGWGCKDVDS